MTDDSIAARLARARAEAAERVASLPLESLIHDPSPEVLRAVAAEGRLTEDLALSLLTRRDLPPQALEDLSKNVAVMKSRKVMLAVVAHPRTPRHVALPIVRHLYTFELMSLALLPALAADLKIAVEEAILVRLETIASGERLALAKRASTRVAAALLADSDARVIEAALSNPFLTEAWVVKAVMAGDAPPALLEAVCRHQKWSVRADVRVALLRNPRTPLPRIVALVHLLPASVLRNVLRECRLPAKVKTCLLQELEERGPR